MTTPPFNDPPSSASQKPQENASDPAEQPQEERRRLSREQGRLMLFAAAQDLARQNGTLGEGMRASLEHSVLSRTSYALKTQEGRLIERFPLKDVRRMLRFRLGLAHRTAARAEGVTRETRASMNLRQRLRLCSDEVRALVWAISYGRRFPTPLTWKRHGLIGAALLLLGVVPGVLYFVWLARRYARYRREMEQLVLRWRNQGKQDPDPSFFSMYEQSL